MTLSLLVEAGVLDPNGASFQKGLKFLLATQAQDGSWHVPSRAAKFQPYFERASHMVTISGFPRSERRGLPTHWQWAWKPPTLTISLSLSNLGGNLIKSCLKYRMTMSPVASRITAFVKR